MPLQKEIDAQRKQIKADGYSISIGELASMYRDGDLDIHPAFQRIFRWDIEQKSRWIESLLLGIPTPSIFVAQRKDGVWDVVDGLQRLSTVFEFMGILKDREGTTKEPLVLQSTRYLPSLEGVIWEGGTNEITEDQRRFLKREKLDIKIVMRESDQSSKFELFQRLNTGGSALSDQELRNCMLVGVDESFFDWLQELSRLPEFAETVPLPESLVNERFDIELILRFMIFRNIDLNEFKGIRSLSEFITDKMMILVENKRFNRRKEQELFHKVFSAIHESMGDDAFRKYDAKGKKFSGAFLFSAFEIVALGLAHSKSNLKLLDNSVNLRKVILDNVWKTKNSVVTKSGESAVARLPRTLSLGRAIFGT